MTKGGDFPGTGFFRWLIFLFLLCVLLPDTAALCGEKKPILFGGTVSGEGRYKAPSRMVGKGYRLWEKQVNEKGGIFGRPVRVILYDDKSRPERARTLYKKLILEDGVDFVLSPYGTPLTMAASEVTERHGYVMPASAAAGDRIWERGFSYVFGMYALAGRYFIGTLDMLGRQGYKNVALLHDETSSFNVAAIKGARKWADRFRLNIVLDQSFTNGRKAIAGIVDTLEKKRVDGVILSAYPPDCHEFLDLLEENQLRFPVLSMTIAPVMPDFRERAGPVGENVFGPSQWEPDERIPFPGTKAFITAFADRYNEKPAYHAGSAFAACRLLEEAVRETGSPDHDRIRDYIVSADTVTVIGRFKVDHKGKQIGHNPLTIQWQNGKKEIVWPAKLRTADPVFNQ